jgi:hypothetical protein
VNASAAFCLADELMVLLEHNTPTLNINLVQLRSSIRRALPVTGQLGNVAKNRPRCRC